MLVLTRRKGEQIFIDKGQIQIQVTSLRRGAVTLAIKAPSHIDVDREEIFLRKQANPQNTDKGEQK
ncbi:TPA: carbon storage regulator [Legionella pneumophila]|jgi:carbon storage regulator|uniref:Translational regulator CsrA n=1 Tax=Legionella pneumophila TaxID=446 RepID=A0A2S8C9G9_LEGPN|nr:carbon storage regulator [Legionella pneumophila]AMQ28350.1 carbon storage regulator CsrA [Legionella pneumophila subsp. pneumophila]MBN5929552.1 carbon storage regulator [Legionella pneumophila]MCO1452132.1 carbon storage regulator [Legionella pneumophila]MCZ4692321.1 carbon storage regulator [Legionella pneumophila]MCZ4711496.1 carbon storage regulator [Legionella pneumophila]